jgi:hypothetical protein
VISIGYGWHGRCSYIKSSEVKMKYMIYDWAGNCLDIYGTFNSFEDAWDYIMGDMTDKLGLTEEDFQEYEVLEVEK